MVYKVTVRQQGGTETWANIYSGDEAGAKRSAYWLFPGCTILSVEPTDF